MTYSDTEAVWQCLGGAWAVLRGQGGVVGVLVRLASGWIHHKGHRLSRISHSYLKGTSEEKKVEISKLVHIMQINRYIDK